MERKLITSQMVFDYILRPAQGVPRELILLLHGFNQSGQKIFNKLESFLPRHSAILAPNGPFPIPFKTENGYKVGQSWYFYNPGTREYWIDMRVAVDFLDQGIRALGFESLPKVIIGFSQGGYLAPIAAHRMGKVRKIIGIGCEYLTDEFPGGLSCQIDGIHGEVDDVVSMADAQTSHGRIKNLGLEGVFYILPGVGHRITSEVQEKLRTLL